jgi:hypothetical protein
LEGVFGFNLCAFVADMLYPVFSRVLEIEKTQAEKIAEAKTRGKIV